ncbi:MAG TPA: TRAM domain-containing protein, partial [bacterium]|nr:TRAM domain-containing protein [bacterium]
KQRELTLDKILKQGAVKNRQKQIGQEVEVLLEEKRGQRYFGRTNQNQQILLECPINQDFTLGKRYRGKVTGARNFSLAGKLL